MKTKCLGKRNDRGTDLYCPISDICLRAEIKRGGIKIYDVMPYNFEDKYCIEFIWIGINDKNI